jgi:hypothetical protein
MPVIRGQLVGVTGKKRAGKDTFAEVLLIHRGYTRVAFADPLRDSILETNPLLPAGTFLPGEFAPYRHIRLAEYVAKLGWHLAKDNPEVRRLLQAHGVSMRNNVYDGVWVEAGLRKAAPILEKGGGVVITDVRFPNEAEAVKANGGVLVRINREGVDTTDRHISEVALDDWPMDVEILNNGTVTDLHEAAFRVVDSLG